MPVSIEVVSKAAEHCGIYLFRLISDPWQMKSKLLSYFLISEYFLSAYILLFSTTASLSIMV